MSLDLNNLSREQLVSLDSERLITMVLALYDANKTLKDSADDLTSRKYDLRLERLEREMNKTKQYIRRDSIEIMGMDVAIDDEDVEKKTWIILKAAQVKLEKKFATGYDIQASHRKGKKGTVIVKFTNRKFAYEALRNSHNLKNHPEYGSIYLNESLWPEFSFIQFVVRKAKKDCKIAKYSIRNGIISIQLVQNGPNIEISHESDLTRNGLTVPVRAF